MNFVSHTSRRRAVRNRRVHSLGVTLIELMVGVAVMGVLASMAAPSLGDVMARSQARAISNNFALSLQRARTEAVNRNQCVTVCVSNDPGAATPQCSTQGGDWRNGWIVFLNSACDSTVTTPARSDVIAAESGFSTRYSLSSSTRSTTFNPRGLPSAGGGSAFQLTDTTVSSAAWSRTLCLDALGRFSSRAYSSTGSCT